MGTKQEYIDTKFGKIPLEWNIFRLKELVANKNDIVAGPFGSNLKVSDYKTEGVPIVRLQNIERNEFKNKDIKYTSAEKAEELEYHSYQVGDLVLAKLGDPIGKTCLVPEYMENGLVVADVVRIRLSPKKADKYFIEYLLNSEVSLIQMKMETIGSTRPRVNISQVRNLQIPLPPLPEQKKIAEILSTVDLAIEKTEYAIKRTEKLKDGFFIRLLTSGIGHRDYVKTQIGNIPKTWDVVRIGSIADVRGGKRLPKGEKLLEHPTPYPYIRVIDFKNLNKDKENIKYLSKEVFEKIKKYTISSKDVYISIAGTIGISGIIPQKFNNSNLTENAAKICNFRRDILNKYLAYVLNSNIGQKQISSYVGKAQQPKLALFRIEKILVPMPPLDEQKLIVEIIESNFRRLRILQKRRSFLERIKNGLMNDLLTGQKRVRVES